jgi:hypothetical protein
VEAEIQVFQAFMDSRSPLSRGQVYPCGGRGGSDSEIVFFSTLIVFLSGQ